MKLLHRGPAAFPFGGDPTRSPGLHLTSIIHWMVDELNMFPGDGGFSELKMAMGCAWEEYLYPYMQAEEGSVRPGEFRLDGIWGTPDAITDSRDWGEVLDEIKLSWFSARNDFEHNGWKLRQWQAVSYLKMMGLKRVRYKILSVCGNWKPPSVPLWEDFVVEYSRKEIDQVWTMILRNREAMEKQRASAQ